MKDYFEVTSSQIGEAWPLQAGGRQRAPSALLTLPVCFTESGSE